VDVPVGHDIDQVRSVALCAAGLVRELRTIPVSVTLANVRMVFMPTWSLLAAAVVSIAVVAGCASPGGAASAGASGGGRPEVITSFYPLQFVTQRIAGDAVTISNLTKPGAEPHDLELTPRDVASLADADLVVYLSGFQPAVDTAVAQQAHTAYDVAGSADLAAKDPHFWLDPIRLADVAANLAARLATLSPAHAADFRRNAATLRTDLLALDADYAAGLAHCASKDLVTSHTAFGYLSRRYGLTQRGITGLRPEDEPSPGAVAKIADFVKAHHVRTIYSETLVSPAVAKTLARETGARTAVLDPIEGLDDASAGADYLAVMRANLDTLRVGQTCR
jgi:zinc transport system substrate-binding protein